MTDWQKYFTNEALSTHRVWMNTQQGPGRLILEHADLRGAQLAGFILVGARFDRCKFDEANLSGAWLTSVECSECNFNHAQIQKASFSASQLHNCTFIDADLTSSDLSASQIYNGSFSNAQLTHCNFKKSHLNSVHFTSAHFEHALLVQTVFNKCSLQSAHLYQAQADDALFMQVDFRFAQIDAFEICRTSFINCGFYNVEGWPFVFENYTVVAPDFSEQFDGTEIVNAQQVYKLWEQERLQHSISPVYNPLKRDIQR